MSCVAFSAMLVVVQLSIRASGHRAVEDGSSLLDDSSEFIDGLVNSDDAEGGVGAERAEVALTDQVGDDWGDAALQEQQRMATRRMQRKNRQLEQELAKLKGSSAHIHNRLREATRVAGEAAAYGHRLDEQSRSLLRNDRDKQVLAQARVGHVSASSGAARHGTTRLGESTGGGSPKKVKADGVQEDSITEELKSLNIKPSKAGLGQDLLNFAVNAGKEVKLYETVGPICNHMWVNLILRKGECFAGSEMRCDKQEAVCQLKNAKTHQWVNVEPETSCYDGMSDCRNYRQEMQYKIDHARKKKADALLNKEAQKDAKQDAAYQARIRKKIAKKAKQESTKALKDAAAEGDRYVQIATLKGNAPLPQLELDQEIRKLKKERLEMKTQLEFKESIFAKIDLVSPECHQPFRACGKVCDKKEPMTELESAKFAVMGKMTPCHLKCKGTVTTCVMGYVANVYKNVTMDALAQREQKRKIERGESP